MEIELGKVLADQRNHPGVVRARAELGEDNLVSAYEELDPEQSVPAEVVDHLVRHLLRLRKRGLAHAVRLPALLVVAAFLPVADRRAEGDATGMPDGQQRDLVIEVDKLLDDHPRPVAAHIGDRIVPRGLQPSFVLHRALALA